MSDDSSPAFPWTPEPSCDGFPCSVEALAQRRDTTMSVSAWFLLQQRILALGPVHLRTSRSAAGTLWLGTARPSAQRRALSATMGRPV